jgi:hypothetical protein
MPFAYQLYVLPNEFMPFRAQVPFATAILAALVTAMALTLLYMRYRKGSVQAVEEGGDRGHDMT